MRLIARIGHVEARCRTSLASAALEKARLSLRRTSGGNAVIAGRRGTAFFGGPDTLLRIMDGLAMDPDRFRQLDGLLQSALQLFPSQREVFLRELSGSDPGLERDLRSLLALERQAGDF